jgi:hypothetical protein
MRNLEEENHLPFYLARGDYYDAVDFDDSVYRVYDGLASGRVAPESYELVLIDEYQDFNALEAGVIEALGERNRIVVAGDDDQALYSQFRDASWDYIRQLEKEHGYDVFELPFCMRCPKVIVDAVADIIKEARRQNRLEGRIDKPYKHYSPLKGADSAKYPKITSVGTSVQSKKANYMGRYIAKAIAEIPPDEIEQADTGGYPVVLVIVAKPYRDQIADHLEAAGYLAKKKQDSEPITSREMGLLMLKVRPRLNLGWRIVLAADVAACSPHTECQSVALLGPAQQTGGLRMTNGENVGQYAGDGDPVPLRRVAIVMAVLGDAVSGEVMKFLADHQIESVLAALVDIENVSTSEVDRAVVQSAPEMEVLEWDKGRPLGGIEFATVAAERAIGPAGRRK